MGTGEVGDRQWVSQFSGYNPVLRFALPLLSFFYSYIHLWETWPLSPRLFHGTGTRSESCILICAVHLLEDRRVPVPCSLCLTHPIFPWVLGDGVQAQAGTGPTSTATTMQLVQGE